MSGGNYHYEDLFFQSDIWSLWWRCGGGVAHCWEQLQVGPRQCLHDDDDGDDDDEDEDKDDDDDDDDEHDDDYHLVVKASKCCDESLPGRPPLRLERFFVTFLFCIFSIFNFQFLITFFSFCIF